MQNCTITKIVEMAVKRILVTDEEKADICREQIERIWSQAIHTQSVCVCVCERGRVGVGGCCICRCVGRSRLFSEGNNVRVEDAL